MQEQTGATREAKLRALAKEQGLDAVIAMSPENFAYASNVHVITVNLLRPRQAFAIIPQKGPSELVLCSIELTLAQAESPIKRIHPYTEFVDNPIDVLVERLRELGLEHGRIGMDLDFLPASSHERLMKKVHNLQLVNTTEAIAAIRAIKEPDEVSFLERAAKGTHRAVIEAMQNSKLGDTERAMCLRIASGIIDYGADGTLFLCFASGDRTPIAHAMATDRVPQESEIIRFDVGGVYGSYASDFARTYSSGNPTRMQRETYAAMLKIERATIEAIRPGILAEDLFYLCRDEYKKYGLNFRMPHIGHSFGVELHESPMLRPGDKSKIAAGMVFNIEPVVADEAGNMYHTEDLVEVTPTGYRIMTLGMAPDEIPVIGQKIAFQA
jgi:Xaa-Pro dipeptidase